MKSEMRAGDQTLTFIKEKTHIPIKQNTQPLKNQKGTELARYLLLGCSPLSRNSLLSALSVEAPVIDKLSLNPANPPMS